MGKKPDKALVAARWAEKRAEIRKELSGKAPTDKRGIHNQSEALCFTCSLATPLLCDWIKNGGRQGLKYKIKPGSKRYGGHIVITGCVNYVPGPLPPVAWERLDYEVFAGVAGCSK